MPDETRPRHPEQLRAAIDRGETGEKVAHPDPAAAPLGTDEEAGGSPTSAPATAQAYRQEVGRHAATDGPATDRPASAWTPGRMALVAGLVVVAVLALVAIF